MKLDLPAFGSPSSPTSASTRSSSARRRLSPGSPRVNWRGAVDAREAVIDERVDVAVGARPDAAAAAAVAAVRAAIADVFLAAEGRGAVAALAGVHLDLRFVDEFHGPETKKPYRLR